MNRNNRKERGASAVEYGLLVAGIAAVIAISVYAFGNIVGGQMGHDCGTIGGAMQSALKQSDASTCS